MTEKTEKTFYSDRGILVTSTRVEIKGAVYVVRLITSVRAERESQFLFATLMVLIGAALLWFARGNPTGGSLACGSVPLLLGLAVGYFGRKTTMLLTTAGGEVKALWSRDRRHIEDVATAVKAAIIYRN